MDSDTRALSCWAPGASYTWRDDDQRRRVPEAAALVHRHPARHTAHAPRRARRARLRHPARPGSRRSPSRSTSRSSTWTGRAAATRTSRPIATADGELDCRGFWKPGDERPDKGGQWTSNAQQCPTLVREVESVGADFGRVRTIRLEPQGYEDALRSIHRDDNNRFNPDGEGWVVRQWIELTDFPDSFMILMEQGARRAPRPEHRGAHPAAPGLAVRGRHATAVARRVPPRRLDALRAHQQLRERSRARSVHRRQRGLRRQTSRLRSGSPRAPTPATRGARRGAIPARRRHRPGRTR